MSSSAPAIGSPSIERTVPLMKHGMPGAPLARSSPFSKAGEPSTKKGPKTVDSVAPGGRRLFMPIDEHGQPEGVGEQDELLALVVGDVPGAGEEVDGGEPLLLGERDLGGEGVQVAHERLQDLAQARIGGAVEAGLDGLGQLGVGEVAPLRDLRGWLLGHSSTFARVARPVKCHCTL